MVSAHFVHVPLPVNCLTYCVGHETQNEPEGVWPIGHEYGVEIGVPPDEYVGDGSDELDGEELDTTPEDDELETTGGALEVEVLSGRPDDADGAVVAVAELLLLKLVVDCSTNVVVTDEVTAREEVIKAELVVASLDVVETLLVVGGPTQAPALVDPVPAVLVPTAQVVQATLSVVDFHVP